MRGIKLWSSRNRSDVRDGDSIDEIRELGLAASALGLPCLGSRASETRRNCTFTTSTRFFQGPALVYRESSPLA